MSLEWRKPSACTGGAACPEVRDGEDEATRVLIRSSRRPDQTVGFTASEWRDFLAGVKNGEFDLPGDA